MCAKKGLGRGWFFGIDDSTSVWGKSRKRLVDEMLESNSLSISAHAGDVYGLPTQALRTILTPCCAERVQRRLIYEVFVFIPQLQKLLTLDNTKCFLSSTFLCYSRSTTVVVSSPPPSLQASSIAESKKRSHGVEILPPGYDYQEGYR